jgi:RimJ/RimL family protein N-acetyltransferase
MSALHWPDPLPAYGSVRLRPYRDDDLQLVAELSADPYVPLIGTVPSRFTEAEGSAYLRRQHQRLYDGLGYSFAVADRTTDEALGGAGLWIHPERPATAGYVIAPSRRGRGAASDALRALLGFAWTLPGIDRVELFIEPWNAASIRVAERCGFNCEGSMPGDGVVGGERKDMLRYGADRSTNMGVSRTADLSGQ